MVFLNSYGKLTKFDDAKRVKNWMEKNKRDKKQVTHKRTTRQPS